MKRFWIASTLSKICRHMKNVRDRTRVRLIVLLVYPYIKKPARNRCSHGFFKISYAHKPAIWDSAKEVRLWGGVDTNRQARRNLKYALANRVILTSWFYSRMKLNLRHSSKNLYHFCLMCFSSCLVLWIYMQVTSTSQINVDAHRLLCLHYWCRDFFLHGFIRAMKPLR